MPDPAAEAAARSVVSRPAREPSKHQRDYDVPRARGPLPQMAFTVPEFCRSHRISVSKYYELKKLGLGPDEMQIDRRIIITVESAAKWRRNRSLKTKP